MKQKQSYKKQLIRSLTIQYGSVFLLIKVYFVELLVSPKYYRLALNHCTVSFVILDVWQ